MFSGIVSSQGLLTKVRSFPNYFRIVVQHGNTKNKVQIGDSLAVNGCCLTVVASRKQAYEFDILRETWQRTCLRYVRIPERVNLEYSLRFGDPICGHLVAGHIDGVGEIISYRQKDSDILLEIKPPRNFMSWIVSKGSVAIDGVSLTVAETKKTRFGVWLIPHTLKLTTLGWKRKGDFVNLEADILAKYTQRLVSGKY